MQGVYLEPGRLIVGNAGVLVASVIFVKKGENKSFVIVERGDELTLSVRPTLYEAHHEIILPVKALRAPRLRQRKWIRADVVGPVCESGDFLALDRDMPAVAAGELIAIMSAGAYGAVQAGTYNSRLLVPEVLVKRRRFCTMIRRRPSYEELIALDTLPPWLAGETFPSATLGESVERGFPESEF